MNISIIEDVKSPIEKAFRAGLIAGLALAEMQDAHHMYSVPVTEIKFSVDWDTVEDAEKLKGCADCKYLCDRLFQAYISFVLTRQIKRQEKND